MKESLALLFCVAFIVFILAAFGFIEKDCKSFAYGEYTAGTVRIECYEKMGFERLK